MLKVKRPFDAYLDEMNKITILLPHAYGTSRTFRLQEGSNVKELPLFILLLFQMQRSMNVL